MGQVLVGRVGVLSRSLRMLVSAVTGPDCGLRRVGLLRLGCSRVKLGTAQACDRRSD